MSGEGIRCCRCLINSLVCYPFLIVHPYLYTYELSPSRSKGALHPENAQDSSKKKIMLMLMLMLIIS